MSIFLEGAVCKICQKPMFAHQKIVSFPPFVSNELDPIWLFNDRSFHSECVDNHAYGQAAQDRLKQAQKLRDDWPPRCFVCNQTITNPDEYFTFGHITDDISDELYSYNYLQCHTGCIRKWPEVRRILLDLEKLNTSGKWNNSALLLIISEISKIYKINL